MDKRIDIINDELTEISKDIREINVVVNNIQENYIYLRDDINSIKKDLDDIKIKTAVMKENLDWFVKFRDKTITVMLKYILPAILTGGVFYGSYLIRKMI